MVLVVGLRPHAALSTTPHGSTNSCMTWPTTDDIKMRVCRNEPPTNEDIEIEAVEICL
jgi:hypothetical protein